MKKLALFCASLLLALTLGSVPAVSHAATGDIYTVGLGYYNYGPHGGLDVFIYVVVESPPPALPPTNPATVTLDVTFPNGSHQIVSCSQTPGDTSGLARCDVAAHPVKHGAYHVVITNVVASGYTWDQAASQTTLDFNI